jgi:hypothetical protein
VFARVTVVQGSPDRYDDAVRIINERAAPGAKQIPAWSQPTWHWIVHRARE